MKENSYNIANLFAESFGLKVSRAYAPEVSEGVADDPTSIYNGIQLIEDAEQAEKMSYLGTPVLFPIHFLGGSYKKYDNTGKLVKVMMSDFQLPAACVIDFNRPKIIAETTMSSGTGEVNEIFGFRSWQIDIKGFFLPDTQQPQGLVSPYDQENMMSNWDELASAIEVENRLMLNRNITSLVIKDFKVTGERGRPNVRPFTLQCKSDEPIEFLIS